MECTRMMVMLLVVWALAYVLSAKITLAETKDGDLVHFGFSTATLGAVNQNDAVAAMRIWGQMLVQETNIPADPDAKIFKDSTAMKNALIRKKVDCINMTAVEYCKVQHLIAKKYMVVGITGDSIDEEYVLLVNRKKNFKTLADLQGRNLRWGASVRSSLALIWLDTVLAERGFNTSNKFFKTISKKEKISDVILPVFFGKVDACVVTRKAFELMVELNPQIGKQTHVLLASPPFVPTIFGFRAGLDVPVEIQIMKELTHWHKSQIGRQILTLFQVERLDQQSTSCLVDTLALLEEHKRLFGSIESN